MAVTQFRAATKLDLDKSLLRLLVGENEISNLL